MKSSISLISLLFVISITQVQAQTTTNDPFPDPLIADKDVILVGADEFAELPDYDGRPARMMLMVDEPGTSRLFVNDMYGQIYSVNYDGEDVSLYININDPEWEVGVEYRGRERGFQSFAFHPDFGRKTVRDTADFIRFRM